MTTPPEDNLHESFIPPGSEFAASDAQHETESSALESDIPGACGGDSAADFSAIPAEASANQPEIDEPQIDQPEIDRPLFYAFTQPPVHRPVRIPHFGHLLLLFLLIVIAEGVLGAGLGVASHFGWKAPAVSGTNLQFNLLAEAAVYFTTFAFGLIAFPLIWHKSYFAGLQWRAAAARSRLWPLAAIASTCCGLAIIDQFFMPGPSNAPIEKMISSPSAAWLMFAFGVTVAPFFEEMFFRGFLLPALSTAADWIAEKVSANSPVILGTNGRVQWPLAGIAAAWTSLGSIPAVCFSAFYWKGGRLAWQILVPYAVAIAIFFTILALRKSASPELARPIGPDSEPQWSYPSMAIAAVVTSVAFASLHLEQQGNSLGPFLLIVLVSLVLCSVRLITRSLAASTLVHAIYNFFVFTILLIGTQGFRHFDKM
jgi:membrane protease YdiL (CAAX protease family)